MQYTTSGFLENSTVEIDGIYTENLVNEYGSGYGVVYHIIGEPEAAARVESDLQMGNQPNPFGSGVWSQIRYETHPSGTQPKEGWSREG